MLYDQLWSCLSTNTLTLGVMKLINIIFSAAEIIHNYMYTYTVNFLFANGMLQSGNFVSQKEIIHFHYIWSVGQETLNFGIFFINT